MLPGVIPQGASPDVLKLKGTIVSGQRLSSVLYFPQKLYYDAVGINLQLQRFWTQTSNQP